VKKSPRRHAKKPAKSINRIYIDQSGKVEGSGDTVIAFANGKKTALLIKAKDKRAIQKLFRDRGKGKVFVFRLFSLLVYLLIKDIAFTEVVIDIEYLGKSSLIKGYLLELFRKKNSKNIQPSQILFHEIGKKCEAHWHSYYVYTGKRKPEKIVDLKLVKKSLQGILG